MRQISYLQQSKLTGWVFILGVALFFSVTTLLVFGMPSELGANIPSLIVESDYIWAYVFSIAVLFVLFWMPLESEERFALMICWLAKSLMSLVFMLWYESYYYFLDAYSYFYHGTHDFSSLSTLEFGDGTEWVNHICALTLKILPGGYHVLKQVFSLLGLVGIFCFYRAFTTVANKRNVSWLIGLCLFPSICFWTSTIGKEPISILGIGLFFLGASKFSQRAGVFPLLLILLGMTITSCIRIWLSVIMLPCFFVLILTTQVSLLGRAWALLLTVMLGIASISFVSDRFEISSRQETLERYELSAKGWVDEGGSGQITSTDFSNPVEIITFMPLGIFTALYRPLPGEVPSILGLLSSIENIFLLFLSVRMILRFRRSDLRSTPIIFSLIFISCWLFLYAPVAYQNLGTAVRFKVQILPALLALFFFLGRKKNISLSLP